MTNRFLRLIFRIDFFKKILNKFKYPKLGLASKVNLNIKGTFKYGYDCGIGEGANIIVPQDADLIFGNGCYIGRYVELGPSGTIKIGSHTSIQDRSIFVGDVIVGRYCLFSLNVLISSGRHYFDLEPWQLIRDQDYFAAQVSSVQNSFVVIEDDCWLGVNVVVMPGVIIGKGAVVGANSVVTKDVEPYTVVAGAPAKFLKKRLDFTPPQSITYTNEHDLPYFYSGFEVSQSSLKKYASYEGIATQSEFSLCLDATLGSSIYIIAKNTDSQKCTLIYGDQRKELSNKVQEVVFKVNDFSRKTFRFCMQVDSANALLIIERAWIQ